MKKVSEFGMPQKDGWYWFMIPARSKTEPLLCRYIRDKDFGHHGVYEWNDIHKERGMSYPITAWKSVPQPKIKQ
jgi:hypothetical protein